MAINVPGAQQAPIYRREQPMQLDSRGADAITDAGKALSGFAEQQASVKQAYDQMVQKRQQAIMQAKMQERQMAESERANQINEAETQRSAQATETYKKEKQAEDLRLANLKESRDAKVHEDEQKLETDWREYNKALLEHQKPGEDGKPARKMTRDEDTLMAEAYGVAGHPKMKAMMDWRHWKPTGGNTYVNWGRKDEASKAGWVNNKVRVHKIQAQITELQNTPPDKIKKLMTKANYAGLPSTKEEMEMDNNAFKDAMLKKMNAESFDAQNLATKSLSDRRLTEPTTEMQTEYERLIGGPEIDPKNPNAKLNGLKEVLRKLLENR